MVCIHPRFTGEFFICCLVDYNLSEGESFLLEYKDNVGTLRIHLVWVSAPSTHLYIRILNHRMTAMTKAFWRRSPTDEYAGSTATFSPRSL